MYKKFSQILHNYRVKAASNNVFFKIRYLHKIFAKFLSNYTWLDEDYYNW